MTKSPDEIARAASAAIRKSVAEGEAIVDRARDNYGLTDRDGDGDGPLMRAWKRGDLPARSSPAGESSSETQPSVLEMVEDIIGFEHAGRATAAALGLAVLRERYDTFDADDLPADERTWRDFARKHLPIGLERINELIGRMAHRGGLLRCTKCGAASYCPCGCGAPYLGEHPWAAMAVEPAKAKTALARAIAAVEAHPEKSNRAIAAEIGVSEPTVRRAWWQIHTAHGADATDDATAARIGRDGKSYRPRSKSKGEDR